MENAKMMQVTVNGSKHTYPFGTPYRVIAADFQKDYPYDILLVNRDGKLCELHKTLDRDCTLKMLTAQDKTGMQNYERSAVFMMLKDFNDVEGSEKVESMKVEY